MTHVKYMKFEKHRNYLFIHFFIFITGLPSMGPKTRKRREEIARAELHSQSIVFPELWSGKYKTFKV